MNTPRRAARALAAVLVLAGTLGACTSGGSDPGPTTSAPSTPATSNSPTKSPEAQAADAAITTWKDYLATQDKVVSDVSVPLTTLANYAAAPELTQVMQDYQAFRAKGYVGGGTRRVDSVTTSQFSTLSDPSTNPPTYPSIHVKGCVDTVSVTLVDSTGKSVQVPNRQVYFDYDVVVSNPNYPDVSAWRVTSNTQKAVASCDSSS